MRRISVSSMTTSMACASARRSSGDGSPRTWSRHTSQRNSRPKRSSDVASPSSPTWTRAARVQRKTNRRNDEEGTFTHRRRGGGGDGHGAHGERRRAGRHQEGGQDRSEENTSELQSHLNIVCPLLLE